MDSSTSKDDWLTSYPIGVDVARLSEPPDTMLLYFELSYEAVMSSTNSQSGDGAPHRFCADTPISEG